MTREEYPGRLSGGIAGFGFVPFAASEDLRDTRDAKNRAKQYARRHALPS